MGGDVRTVILLGLLMKKLLPASLVDQPDQIEDHNEDEDTDNDNIPTKKLYRLHGINSLFRPHQESHIYLLANLCKYFMVGVITERHAQDSSAGPFPRFRVTRVS